MKLKMIFLYFLAISISYSGNTQSQFNLGIGYYGDAVTQPGVIVEFEIEKFFSDDFSLPLRADFGFYTNPDYNALFLDVHKGWRKYFDSGLYIEQSLGLGVLGIYYDVESIYYVDKYLSVIRYNDGINLGISPSVTAGVGYNITRKKEASNFIWLRPKVYWNLGFRSLHLPYFALQAGFTHNLKTK